MSNGKIIEPIGFIVAILTAIFSLWLFYTDTQVFMGSLSAALIAAGLAWISYVIVRILILALKSGPRP